MIRRDFQFPRFLTMIPQFPEFKKLELSDKYEIQNITNKFKTCSDFNFVSMFAWNTGDKFLLSILNSHLIVRFTDYITEEPFYSILGSEVSETDIGALITYTKEIGVSAGLRLVPEYVVSSSLASQFLVTEDRDNFDYIYSTQLLTHLKGGTFETKRNLINRFHKFTPNPHIELIHLKRNTVESRLLKLFSTWEDNKATLDEKFEAKHELQAITRLLENCDELNLRVLCLYSSEALIGFSIFEVLDNGEAICHFAKTNQHFTGAHDYIMQKQAEWLYQSDISYLNYEQDLGIDSLRHSKVSFRPSDMLKKYTVRAL